MEKKYFFDEEGNLFFQGAHCMIEVSKEAYNIREGNLLMHPELIDERTDEDKKDGLVVLKENEKHVR